MASVSKGKGLEVGPLVELELDIGDKRPTALPDPPSHARLYSPEDENREGKSSLRWPTPSIHQTSADVSEP